MDFKKNKNRYIHSSYGIEMIRYNKLISAFINNSEGVCGKITYDGNIVYQKFSFDDKPMYFISFKYFNNMFQKLIVYDVKYDYTKLGINVKKIYEFNKEDVEIIKNGESPCKTKDIDNNKYYEIIKSIQLFFNLMN